MTRSVAPKLVGASLGGAFYEGTVRMRVQAQWGGSWRSVGWTVRFPGLQEVPAALHPSHEKSKDSPTSYYKKRLELARRSTMLPAGGGEEYGKPWVGHYV